MKTRNLAVLALVVVAVAGYIFFYERHQLSTEEARERADKVFQDLERDAVDRLDISNRHGLIRLAKEDGHWQLTEPIAFAADDAAVSSLLGALADLEAERRLAEGEVDPSAYALDEPEMVVELGAGEERRWVLRVGAPTPLGSNRAVATTAPGIFLCPSTFTVHLDKSVDDWRSRDVVEAFETDLASLELATANGPVKAVRVGGEWRLLEPLEDHADRDHLRRLVGDLNSLRIEEFIVDGEGLFPAVSSARVTLVRSDGEAPTTLELGVAHPDGEKGWVACRRDGRDTFWVRDSILTPLDKAPVLWRDPKVLTFDSWDATAITVAHGDTRVAVTRDQGVWTDEEGNAADFAKVQAFLTALAGLEARAFDLAAPTTEELARVELSLDGDGESSDPITFVISAPMSEGGRALVSVSARATVMSVEVSDLEPILVSASAFAPDEPDEALDPLPDDAP